MAKKQAKDKAEAKLRVQWVKSSIGYSQQQKATVKSLGFKRLGETVEWEDSPMIRGMIERVSHLVEVEELDDRN